MQAPGRDETMIYITGDTHGNHEQRPYTIDSYKEKLWHGGTVFYEEEYPSILFAKDGEIFELNGKQTIVMGGAYRIGKSIRIAYGWAVGGRAAFG